MSPPLIVVLFVRVPRSLLKRVGLHFICHYPNSCTVGTSPVKPESREAC
jgi:hypothetical protein